jgi:excisionase family DNA binding protein
MKRVNENEAKLVVASRDRRRDGFASADQAAAFLSISRPMVTKLVQNGAIPYKRYGKALRIPWAWLLEQVGEGRTA